MSRSPHGECGLKWSDGYTVGGICQSLPAWGVWIEILAEMERAGEVHKSLPAWGVWIEIGNSPKKRENISGSLPAWGVWIEIVFAAGTRAFAPVAPRMGSVD